MEPSLSEESGYWDRKKAGEIIEIELNQKDGRQIAPSRSPLNDLSVQGEVGASLRSVTYLGSLMRISNAFFWSRYQPRH
jgi:hypothetical protein